MIINSAGNLWQPAELENVANPDFEYLKHLQNPGHLLLTTPSMLRKAESPMMVLYTEYIASFRPTYLGVPTIILYSSMTDTCNNNFRTNCGTA